MRKIPFLIWHLIAVRCTYILGLSCEEGGGFGVVQTWDVFGRNEHYHGAMFSCILVTPVNPTVKVVRTMAVLEKNTAALM